MLFEVYDRIYHIENLTLVKEGGNYLFKLSFKYKLNYIPLILPFCVLFIFLLMNMSVDKNIEFITMIKEEIQVNTFIIESVEDFF